MFLRKSIRHGKHYLAFVQGYRDELRQKLLRNLAI